MACFSISNETPHLTLAILLHEHFTFRRQIVSNNFFQCWPISILRYAVQFSHHKKCIPEFTASFYHHWLLRYRMKSAPDTPAGLKHTSVNNSMGNKPTFYYPKFRYKSIWSVHSKKTSLSKSEVFLE